MLVRLLVINQQLLVMVILHQVRGLLLLVTETSQEDNSLLPLEEEILLPQMLYMVLRMVFVMRQMPDIAMRLVWPRSAGVLLRQLKAKIPSPLVHEHMLRMNIAKLMVLVLLRWDLELRRMVPSLLQKVLVRSRHALHKEPLAEVTSPISPARSVRVLLKIAPLFFAL